MLDRGGREVPGNRGYKYFGAARDLPGVRELFAEAEAPAPPRATRGQLARHADADYYGYRDDDDGVLLPLEHKAEQEARERAVAEWHERRKRGESVATEDEAEAEDNVYTSSAIRSELEAAGTLDAMDALDAALASKADVVPDDDADDAPQPIAAHLAVPSQEDVERALVERRKRELLSRYAMDMT